MNTLVMFKQQVAVIPSLRTWGNRDVGTHNTVPEVNRIGISTTPKIDVRIHRDIR